MTMTAQGAGSDWPTGKYRVILADPAWSYQNWTFKELAERGEKYARGRGRITYPTLSVEEICALPVGELADKDCLLFLWATHPKLKDALTVMEAWGFEYKTTAFTWVKTRGAAYHLGLGFWTRQNPEVCLLGTRGKPKRKHKDVPNLIVSPLRGHSRKPDEQYGAIERLTDGPYCELFARQRREGWVSWGNQVPDAEGVHAEDLIGFKEGARIVKGQTRFVDYAPKQEAA